MKTRIQIVGLTLLAFCLPKVAVAQWTFSAGYNVLDVANDDTGGITGVTSSNYGNTTGLERGIAYRPGTPGIVYIGRGGTTTGDGRTGGVIGIAAIKLEAYGASNYTDTGIITSGGAPANFSFIQGIFYEPTCDKVWVIDGASSTARLWYFNGGALGGAPSGGGVASQAVATGITHITQMSNASSLGGTGRGLAVRVSGDCSTGTVTVAVAMGSHLEVWESTAGMGGPFSMKFESANDMDGTGTTYTAFGSGAVRDVTFDPEGNIWIGDPSNSKRAIHGFAFASSGTGVLPSRSIQLPRTNLETFEGSGTTGNVNSVKMYKDGSYVYLLASFRSSDTASAFNRFVRTGSDMASYAFVLTDGFGQAWTGGATYADTKVQTARYKVTTNTQPSGATQALMYMSMPYSSSSTLALGNESVYINTFITDSDKGHTKPTSGVYQIGMPAMVYAERTFDAGTGASTDPPTTDKEYLGFSLNTDHGTATVTEARCFIASGSTATTSDIAAVKLWLDVNGDNLIDGGDTLLGTATHDGTDYVVTGLSQSITATAKRYIWGVDRVGSMALGKTSAGPTLALRMDFSTTAQDVVVATGGILAPLNFPIQNASSTPLPIELADFTAQATKDMVTLNWQTISEVNSDVFEVQHLVDGAWKTVATVQAAGSSTDVRSYTQAIQGLQVGTHYFRLKSVGKDGGVKYSKQVTVSVEVPGTFVMNPAYPNPFNPQTTLTFAVSQKQAVTMTLFNALGQQISVLYQGVPEANTLQTIQLNGSTLQSGAYFVRLMGENFSGMQKVMLVK